MPVSTELEIGFFPETRQKIKIPEKIIGELDFGIDIAPQTNQKKQRNQNEKILRTITACDACYHYRLYFGIRNSSNILNQTSSEKQLQTINCRVFDAIDTPMSDAIITISYDPSRYSDGFILGRNDSVRNIRTDENGNFSISLNKSIQYNFTISESHLIPKQNPFSYSTMLIPLNNDYIKTNYHYPPTCSSARDKK